MYKPKQFLRDMLGAGLSAGLEVLDKEAEPYIPELLKNILKDANLPEDVKKFILPLPELGAHSPIAQFFVMAIAMAAGFALGMASPAMRVGSYQMDKLVKTARRSPAETIALWFRLGKPDDFDFSDLFDLGWKEEDIGKFKTIYKALPSMGDVIRFAVREVYSPDIARKYGQFEGLEEVFKQAEDDILAAGMSKEVFEKYWAAHWVLPSVGQGFEMLHRGKISEEELEFLFVALDIMPAWRDKLKAISYVPYTRVDARRMWDLGALDDDQLLTAYTDGGFDKEHAENMVVFTKLFERLPELRARFRNGWITEEEMRSDLAGYGVKPERIEPIMETIIKAEKPQQIEEHRKLTRALIIKGVKKEQLSEKEAIALLMEHQNYDEATAKYIMDVELAEMGTPETLLEFKKLVAEGRKALGLPAKDIPDDAIQAGLDFYRAKVKHQEAVNSGQPLDVLDKLAAEMALAEAKYNDLLSLYELS